MSCASGALVAVSATGLSALDVDNVFRIGQMSEQTEHPMRHWLLFAVVGVIQLAGCGGRHREQGNTARPGRRHPEGDVVRPDSVPGRHRRASLSCTISTDKATYKVGELPRIKVEIRNLTGKDIYLVRSLDKSECRHRYPHCYYEVTDFDGTSHTAVFQGSYPSPIGPDDFVRVPAGAAFDPVAHLKHGGLWRYYPHTRTAFWRPGKYRIRFTYSSDNPDLDAWWGGLRGRMGREDEWVAEIRRLFGQVPKTTVRSNEVTVEFVE